MRNLTTICVLVLGVLLYSCAIFEEKPVTNEVITITSPGNLTTVTSLNVTFIWSEIQNSTPFKYNIQVATPDFITPSYFVIDTNTTKTKYTKTLVPGNYACRVRVYNGSTQSQYTTINFVVDTARKVSGLVNLTSPADKLKSNLYSIVFSWDKIPFATGYTFQVFSINTDGDIIEPIKDTTTSLNQIRYEFKTGQYLWQVKAINNSSTTRFTSRTFTINGKTLKTPILASPIQNSTVTAISGTFTWNKDQNTIDSLIILSDDSVSRYSSQSYSIATSNGIAKDIILESGTYYWYVKSSDSYGNVSQASEVKKFIFVLTQ